MSSPTVRVPRGVRSAFVVELVDPATGRVDVRWASDDAPSARVWPGMARTYSVPSSVAWDGEPLDGARVAIAFEAADSALLPLGRCRLVVLVDAGDGPTQVAERTIEVVPAPTATEGDEAPRAYATPADLRELARPFVESLATRFDQADLGNLLAGASRELDERIIRRFAGGPIGAAARRAEMLGLLDAGGLAVDEGVRRWVAFRAVHLLASFTPAGESKDLDRIRDAAEREAGRAMRGLVAHVGGYAIPLGPGPTRLVR